MEIDTHLRRGTKDFGFQRTDKSSHERDEKEGGSQPTAEVDNLTQFVGGHRRGARESETLLFKPCGEASRALASNERIHCILDTEQKPLDLVCEASDVICGILLRVIEVFKVLRKPLRALRARPGTVERKFRLALDKDSKALCILAGPGADLIRVIVLVCFTNFVRVSAH
jgi:hypothetical protein